jgi:hypothetical protein
VLGQRRAVARRRTVLGQRRAVARRRLVVGVAERGMYALPDGLWQH